MFDLSRLPIWVIGVVIVGGFVVLSCGGLLLYRRITHGRLNLPEDMNNDVIFFASAISVFYSLTVGLIAVGVWTNYAEMQTITAQRIGVDGGPISRRQQLSGTAAHRADAGIDRLHGVRDQRGMAGTVRRRR